MKRLLIFMAMLAGMAIIFNSCNNGAKEKDEEVSDDRVEEYDEDDEAVYESVEDVDSMMPGFETMRMHEPGKIDNNSETASAAEEKNSTSKKKSKQKDVPDVAKKTEDKQTKEVNF